MHTHTQAKCFEHFYVQPVFQTNFMDHKPKLDHMILTSFDEFQGYCLAK